MSKLKVNEIFGPTYQGEGRSAGMPCAFIRLAFCNLHCVWCDTPHTWNWKGSPHKHPIKYDIKVEVHTMTHEEVLEKILATGAKAVVISGGEPTLQHKELLPLIKELKERDFWVEVETNGTVLPSDDFIDYVDQINCSPKLASSGNELELRRVPAVLTKYANTPKVNFKFVVQDENDIQEAGELTEQFGLKEVRLMPECRTKEELLERSLWVRKEAAKHGFLFTTRMSIMESGTKRGV